MSIHHNIRKIRQLRGYTQRAMAEKLCIEQNTYSKIESGQTAIADERLESIAMVLKVPKEFIRRFDADTFIKNACVSIRIDSLTNFF